jgi:hypothetical protein
MKDEKGFGHSVKQKSPAETGSARVFGCGRQKRLLLAGSGGGFAGTHFEAFFAKYTAALFGSFF